MRPALVRILPLMALSAGTPVQAAIFTVGSDAACTHNNIQAAIDAADAVNSTGADEIRLSGGPYTGQDLSVHVAANHGAIAIAGGFANCASAQPVSGARTVIGGIANNGDPVLRIADTADATLRNLEIRDGIGGGGLVIETSTGGNNASWVTLIDTRIVHNSGPAGGGIRVANLNPGSAQTRLRLDLLGDSEVAFNNGFTLGGGIACTNAKIEVHDTASIHENGSGITGIQASRDGGGLHADNCLIDVTSTNPQVLSRNYTLPPGRGGGLYATGALAHVDFYSTVPGASVYIVNNRATHGGGIALAAGATVRMIGSTGLYQNTGDASGGAIWLAPGDASGVDTHFIMKNLPDASTPEGALGCLGQSLCTQIIDNRAVDASSNSSVGAVLATQLNGAGSARVELHGVRVALNDGYNLVSQSASHSQVIFDGSLVTDNAIRGSFGAFASQNSANALVLSASTVANNAFDAADSTVFGTPVSCDANNDSIGTHLRRSIVWQPRHGLLFTLIDPPQADCFTHLIANDFGWLGPAADRVVADPQFSNPTGGDYRPSTASPALDFAPAAVGDATADGGLRVIDIPDVTNLFGPQDLGALERSFEATVNAAVYGIGGLVGPPTQTIAYGQPATINVVPLAGWHVDLPVAGDCPSGLLQGTTYVTGPVIADCSLYVDFMRDTAIALTGTDPAPVHGQSITLTATIAGSAPTGSVSFRDGASVIGTAPIVGSSANFTTTALGTGTHALTAQYAGDDDNTASTSPTYAVTVNRAATSVVVLQPASIRLGQLATITAVVTPAPPGSGTPGGSVVIAANAGSGSCTFTLPQASCQFTPTDAIGSVPLTASYAGDANFTASSSTQTLQVTPQFVGGSVTGLSVGPLVLQLVHGNGSTQLLTVAAGASAFQFAAPVPVGAPYTATVYQDPPGLSCAVANGSGNMPAGDVGNVAVACADTPSASLTLSVDDGISFARYGQALTYTVRVGNIGTLAANTVAIATTASAGLDAGALSWTCAAAVGAATCAASGSGSLADTASLPINSQVVYTVHVPVFAATNAADVRFEVSVNAGQRLQIDTNTLVLMRDGFDGP